MVFSLEDRFDRCEKREVFSFVRVSVVVQRVPVLSSESGSSCSGVCVCVCICARVLSIRILRILRVHTSFRSAQSIFRHAWQSRPSGVRAHNMGCQCWVPQSPSFPFFSLSFFLGTQFLHIRTKEVDSITWILTRVAMIQ